MLSDTAKHIFTTLYSFSNETPDDTYKRVSKEFSKTPEEEKIAYTLQKENIWRPNTPVYFNAGTKHKVFSACWVLGMEDSMDSIYDVANLSRKIFQQGSGVGIPIGNLREKESYIYEGNSGVPPTGKSSGPISFMKLFNAVGETTKSGGRTRRAAIMCMMPVWHPDILEFIGCKEIDGSYQNMNISVAITDKFMAALKDNVPFPLISPSNGSVITNINPSEIWDQIATMGWKSADPGIFFIDTANKFNPLKKLYIIETTNPCITGEILVSTPYGYKQAKDFFIGDEIITTNGIRKIDNIEINNNSQIYKVEFSDGGYIRCTKDHQFHAIKYSNGKNISKKYEEIKLCNLSVGDWVRVNPSIIPKNTLPIKEKYTFTDKEIGFLAGCFIGDGTITQKCIDKNFIKLASNQDDIEWNKIIEKMFMNYSIDNHKKNKGMNYCIKDKNIIDIIKQLNIIGYSHTKRIPLILKNTNKDFLSGLLDGYFSTDGNINLSSNHPTIRLSSCNKTLLTDIKDILLMFGIHCSFNKSIRKKQSIIDGRILNGKNKYEIIISGDSIKKFYTDIGITNPYKKEKLNKAVKEYSLTGNTWKSRIISIEPDGIETTYDLHEPTDDNWITNGYVSRGCGEQPLIPFSACNLSSINVSKFATENGYDWVGLYKTAYVVMRLMDNLIDVMHFPDKRFEHNVKKYRPVGIGIMGLADALYEMGYKYDGVDGKEFAGKIMKTITSACVECSVELAKQHGPFHDYNKVKIDIEEIITQHIGEGPILEEVKKYGVRNCQFTTAAPTGTTSLSCDCSYGIEPSFGIVFKKNVMDGTTLTIINPVFEKKFKGAEWYKEDLFEKIITNNGSLKGLRSVPKEVRDVFIVAHDIKYKDRIDMQAELQKFCSTAISSTINLPSTTTKDEISDLYKYAHEKGLKGVTVYRDGSKKNQPVSFTKVKPMGRLHARPSKLSGNVHIIETGNGKLYVTVSMFDGSPVEVFLNMGKSGQLFNVFSEALGRAISISLQHGVPVETIVKTMEGINSDCPVWFRFEDTDKKPTQILSIPDGLAKLLKRYYVNGGKHDDDSNIIEKEICSQCGTKSLIFIEGCKTCISCGFSACS